MTEEIDLGQGSLIYQKLPTGDILGYDDGRVVPMSEWVQANRELFTGRTILDLGANTGHMGIEYLRAGAERVYCIEGRVRHCQNMERVAKLLGYQDQMIIHHDDVRHFEVPPHDILSCLGLVYHVNNIWHRLAEILLLTQPLHILIESQLWDQNFDTHDNDTDNSAAIAHELVHRRTAEKIEDEIVTLGYKPIRQDIPFTCGSDRGFWLGVLDA